MCIEWNCTSSHSPSLYTLLQVFDAFNPRLTDRNSKVNVRALVAFSNMVPLLGDLLIPVSANVIKALMPNLASKNSTIHSAAMTVFDLISQCVGTLSITYKYMYMYITCILVCTGVRDLNEWYM